MTTLHPTKPLRRLGGALFFALTVVFVVIVASTACLGIEIAISYTATSGYSLVSLCIDGLYLAAAIVMPMLVILAGFRSQERTRSHVFRLAATISLVVQLCFFPFALLLFAM
jgi:uncharacterized membrane protein YozB (DUF420 family)